MKRLFIFLSACFILGCVSDKDFERLHNQVVELNYRQQRTEKIYKNEIESLKKKMEDLISKTSFSMRSSQADIASRVEALRLEVAKLEGRYDLLQRELKEEKDKGENCTTEIASLEQDLIEVKKDVELLKKILGVGKGLKKQKKGELQDIGAKKVEKVKAKEEVIRAKHAEISPSRLYEEALNNFKQKNYYIAVHLFSLFIEKFPGDKLVPNAYFWRGECYFKLKQYPKAILSYQVVLDKYKFSNKYPAALLKEGISFYKINKKRAGHLLLKELIKNFPDSKEAKIAKEFLRKL